MPGALGNAREVNGRMSDEPQRIGVFGGTFDPVHHAHLEVARAARDAARLDKVLFVVSARPPHKIDGTVADPEQRFAMVEAALNGDEAFEASRIELDREGPSYTADTLETLHDRYPNAELFLIIGEDSLVDLPKWREPERILSRAHLLVVPRPGIEAKLPDMLEGHYDVIPFREHEISSTDIRRRLSAGDGSDDLLPRGVRDVIDREGLYGAEVSDTPRR